MRVVSVDTLVERLAGCAASLAEDPHRVGLALLAAGTVPPADVLRVMTMADGPAVFAKTMAELFATFAVQVPGLVADVLFESVTKDELDRITAERDDARIALTRIGVLTKTLRCPGCHKLHVDTGRTPEEAAWAQKPHRTHLCVDDSEGNGCGRQWSQSPSEVVAGVQAMVCQSGAP